MSTLSSTIADGVEEQVRLSAAAAAQTGGKVLVGGVGMLHARLPEEARLMTSMRMLDAEAAAAGRRKSR